MSNALMDAIGYVGDSLEKPGRAVRGVLAGKGREALAAIPFSDSMGLTDEHERTSGRDLTDMYGLTDKHDHSFGSSALGFGADMVTDPLNLIAGYGAFKAAPTIGKGLKAGAGALTGLDILGSAANFGRRALGNGVRPAESLAGHGNELADMIRMNEPIAESLQLGVHPAPSSSPIPSWEQESRGGHAARQPIMADPADSEQFARMLADPNRESQPWFRGTKIANGEGVGARAIWPATWDAKRGKGYSAGAAAVYQPDAHEIRFNMGWRGQPNGVGPWQDSDAMRRVMENQFLSNHFSSGNPDHLAFHEAGHAVHRNSLGVDNFNGLIDVLNKSDKNTIKHHVGNYAATDPHELVAEIYAALRGGRQFDSPKVAGAMLQHFAGTPMLDRLANQGLLKGVGLSALLAAYGLNSQGGEPSGV